MQMGMIGLGRMGANMVRRLLRGGHECVVFDVSADAVKGLVKEGAIGASSLDDFRAKLKKPRVAWMMVPAAVVEKTLADLSDRFEPGDILVDGGNSYYVDDIRRAKALRAKGLHYVDSGTSGGVWGLERGFCQMIGGEPEVVEHLDPIFATLAPPLDSAPRTAGREQYGRDYAARFLNECRRHAKNPEDALATATALTAESIAKSYERFVRPKMKGAPVDYIVSGGGARNATLIAMLSRWLEPIGCRVMAIEEFGMPAEAKEAAAAIKGEYEVAKSRLNSVLAAYPEMENDVRVTLEKLDYARGVTAELRDAIQAGVDIGRIAKTSLRSNESKPEVITSRSIQP